MPALKEQVRIRLKKALNCLAGIPGKTEKKIVFESYSGRHYSDNPRFISEKMHALYPDYTLVWGCREGAEAECPDYVVKVPVNSFRYRREIATAFAFIRNETMTPDLYKRPTQRFIQTWHGDRGIKRILYDARQERKLDRTLRGIADPQLTDLFVVGSDYAAKRIQSAFRYHGEVLKAGCPRNDCLVHPGNGGTEVRRKLSIPEDKKILLYAPTFRHNSKIVKGKLDIADTLRHLTARGESWICLVRAHPKSLGLEVTDSTQVMDVSAWPDMSDLLMAADMLITDYSSSAGDFVLRGKPVILAQFDREQYMEENRTFFVDPREAGFLIADTQQQLNELLDEKTDRDYAENCERVLRFFGACETGRSAEAVCTWIDGQYQKMKRKS